MSDTRSPAQSIEAFEASAFRAGRVARALLAAHPELPISGMIPRATRNSATLEIQLPFTDSEATVRAWAKALGAEASVERHLGASGRDYVYLEASAEIDGVTVTVFDTVPLAELPAQAEASREGKDTRTAGESTPTEPQAGLR